MNLFQPKPVTYDQYDRIDNERARKITRFPQQVVCARIVPILWVDEILKEQTAEY